MWYCLPLTVNGAGCVFMVLLVKVAFKATIMRMLMSVRFDRVGLGIRASVFLDRDVIVVKLVTPVLSSR